MKKFMAFLFFVLFVGGAFAAAENVPTSKSYVDSKLGEKQDIIPANDGAARVLTNTGTAGEYGTRGIYDANGDYATQQNNLVDAVNMNAAVQNAIDSEFECVDNNCELVNVSGANVRKSPNLFDVSKIPTRLSSSDTQMINNGDGSITAIATRTNSAVKTRKKLSQLAPNLIADKTYTYVSTASYEGSRAKEMTLINEALSPRLVFYWQSGVSKKITQDLLDAEVYFQASTDGTPNTISDIQITEGTDVKPYVAYGNVYMPVGQ